MFSTREIVIDCLRLRKWSVQPDDVYDDPYVRADCDKNDAHLSSCIEGGQLKLPQVGLYTTYQNIQDVIGRQTRDTQQRNQSSKLVDAATWLRQHVRPHNLKQG